MASPSLSQHRIPAEIPGWHKLPGSARRYENLLGPQTLPSGKVVPTGGTIARRDYVDMQARALGWKSWADYQYTSKQAGGLGGMRSEAASAVNWTLQLAEKRQGEPNVPNISTPELRRQYLRQHAADLRALRADPNDMTAHGPLARWLEALGIREQNAPYNVGDTPHTKRRR